MIHFECDYACGASKSVLEALVKTNCEQTSGYGEDEHCERARELIAETAEHHNMDNTGNNADIQLDPSQIQEVKK